MQMHIVCRRAEADCVRLVISLRNDRSALDSRLHDIVHGFVSEDNFSVHVAPIARQICWIGSVVFATGRECCDSDKARQSENGYCAIYDEG